MFVVVCCAGTVVKSLVFKFSGFWFDNCERNVFDRVEKDEAVPHSVDDLR
jgi:hypothetical protein